MPNFADIQKKNQQRTVQSVKAIQEISANYVDRENQINGYKGGASQILARFSPKACTATFGALGGGSCVGS